ncbi:MAG: sodium:alanine symporter family protein [Bacillota bacterium]
MDGFLNNISEINAAVKSVLWGAPMLALLMGTGIWLTVRCGFFQFTHFGHAMKTILRPRKGRPASGRGAVSPFQAVTTALAATIGTGNIAGVAGAIALGGPGALFWMWISALVGMATKYAEVVLAVRFRKRNRRGDWVGGPMYYITTGLGRQWRWLAVLFALFGALAAFGIGNMAQINTIASSIAVLTRSFLPGASGTEPIIKAGVGVAIAALSGLVLIGGLKRIGSVTERLIPAACIAYVLCCLAVIILHIERLGDVFREILDSAFHPYAIAGGAAGITARQALRCGVSRGVFSNEAGMGSASIAHAAADTDSPARQGLYGIFEVFVDTILTCSLTGLAVLVSGVPVAYGQSTGAELTIGAFATTFGGRTASVIVATGITLFAGATILSWALYGMRCAEYLLGPRVVLPYQVLYLLFTVLGAVLELSFVWDISETLNGLMAIPNLIAVFALSGVVAGITRKYRGSLYIGK